MGAGYMRDLEKRNFARRLRKSMTRAEVLLWAKLRGKALGYRFKRQSPIGPFVADFACVEVKLALEVDGATHGSNDEIAYDESRTRYFERNGWRVLRFWNREVIDNIDGVLESISRAAWEQENWLKELRKSP
jgi:very-short-patch-repair endonuclease